MTSKTLVFISWNSYVLFLRYATFHISTHSINLEIQYILMSTTLEVGYIFVYIFWIINVFSQLIDHSFLGGSCPLPLRHPSLDPACPLFKIYISPPLFSVPPTFKVFQTIPLTLTQPPPAPIQHTNLPYI